MQLVAMSLSYHIVQMLNEIPGNVICISSPYYLLFKKACNVKLERRIVNRAALYLLKFLMSGHSMIVST